MYFIYIKPYFLLFYHKDLYATTEEEGHESKWVLKITIILVIATVIIARK